MENFHSFSITHEGAKHDDNVPCQDASDHLDSDTAAIAVVADGHGSSRCFRSDIGSKKAVEIAKGCVAAFVNKAPELPSEMTIQIIGRREVEMSESRIALGNLVKEIINKWFAAVMKDEEEHPLKNDQRIEGIAQKYKDRYINDIDYRCHAYGTTLMVAVMTEAYWFGFHIGDGKCIVLYEDGSWGLPIPWDNRCTFNTTTSICDDDSLSGFRYWFGFNKAKDNYIEYGYGVHGQGKDYIREIESRPLAVFIGSDGVEDSYPRVDNDKYIINFYRNRIVSLAENGFDAFNEEISGLAKRFADRESTDDVSIAGIVGELTGKANMIIKMKQDSEAHEAGVLASVKRRDADEKKDAFITIQKKTDAVMENQRKLESRIAAVESELTALDTKKKSYESALSKSKAEVVESDRFMMECNIKLKELERGKSELAREEKIISAKITLADEDERKARKFFMGVEKERIKKKDVLRKKQDSYDKYLHKRCTEKMQEPPAEQSEKDKNQAAYTYDVKRNIPSQVRIQHSYASINAAAADAWEEWLKKDVENANAELQFLQAQVEAARQSVGAKERALSALCQQLHDAKQRTQQVESEIKYTTKDLQAFEMMNKDQRDAVKQYQRDIEEIERNSRAKQTEINKLNSELETFKEQTKKQRDTLDSIKAAWEKAEAEAKALEGSNRSKKQDGEG